MKRATSVVCMVFLLSVLAANVSASMNPNARIADTNTTCADADQNGPWEYSVSGGDTIELSICFTNPSNDMERFEFNYSLTGQRETENDNMESGHILSVPEISAEVAAGGTKEITVLIQVHDFEDNRTDELTVDFWAKNNQSIPSESIVISLNVDASSGMVPFVNPIMTAFVIVFAGAIYGRKLEF